MLVNDAVVDTCTHYALGILSTVQSRDENHFVAVLEFVLQLSFQLPICIVDEDENTRSSSLSTGYRMARAEISTHTPSPSPNISSLSLSRSDLRYLIR